MQINHDTKLAAELIHALNRLSPNKRQISGKALALTQDASLDNLIRHLDGDPAINELLLDPVIREEILREAAGEGYKVAEYTPSARDPKSLNRGRLVPDKAINYGGLEQDLIDLYSLKRDLDYESTGRTVSLNKNSPIYQSLYNSINRMTPGSVKSLAMGGIKDISHKKYGKRQYHPELPELNQETALRAATNQMIDNLLGNERGEQPSGMLMKDGTMSGYPVEHKKDFQKYPQYGYDPRNRMLGSTFKNSVRQDASRIDSYVRLASKIAEKENEILNKYGSSAEQLGQLIDYPYIPLTRRAGQSLGIPVVNITSGTSTRINSPGNNRDIAYNIRR